MVKYGMGEYGAGQYGSEESPLLSFQTDWDVEVYVEQDVARIEATSEIPLDETSSITLGNLVD